MNFIDDQMFSRVKRLESNARRSILYHNINSKKFEFYFRILAIKSVKDGEYSNSFILGLTKDTFLHGFSINLNAIRFLYWGIHLFNKFTFSL